MNLGTGIVELTLLKNHLVTEFFNINVSYNFDKKVVIAVDGTLKLILGEGGLLNAVKCCFL